MKSTFIRFLLILSILANICVIAPGSATGTQTTESNQIPTEISVYLDNEKIEFDVLPIIESGRTLVPVRAIFEAMGMTVTWDETTETVTAVGNGNTISLIIDRNDALVNGRVYYTDVPARILNGRTIVPVRFISESLHAAVEWDETKQLVSIFSGRISDDRTRTMSATYSSLLPIDGNEEKTTLGDITFDFPYSDRFFVPTRQNENGYGYNHQLLCASLALQTASWPPESSLDEPHYDTTQTTQARMQNLLALYHQLYLKNIEQHNYEKSLYDNTDSAAYSFASKPLYDGSTLIAVNIRGAGYGAEWRSNFHVGSDKFHQGFYLPAKNIYDDLTRYMTKHNYNYETTKLWVTGFSRAGAIGNLLAGMVNDNKLINPDHLYAYLFAVPNTVDLAQIDATNKKYTNIKNIILPHDFITKVPLNQWNWGRYGVTLTVKDTESQPDANHVVYFNNMTNNQILYGSGPETTTELNQLIACINKIIPSQKKYDQTYQNFIMDFAEWSLFRAPYSGEDLKTFVQDKYGSDEKMDDAELFFSNEIKPAMAKLDLLAMLFAHVSIMNNPVIYEAIHQTSILMYMNGMSSSDISQFLLQIINDMGGTILSGNMTFFGPNSASNAHNSEYYIAWMFGYDNGKDIFQEFPY